jgi:hypothetical protein
MPIPRSLVVLAMALALGACRPRADTAAPEPAAAAPTPVEPPADEPETPEPEPEPDAPELSAATEVIEIGVADVGSAAMITAAPTRPAMPSMLSEIRMGPSR